MQGTTVWELALLLMLLEKNPRASPRHARAMLCILKDKNNYFSLEELEKKHIQEVLEQTDWRVSGEKGAAKILGLKRTTLEARMQKLGISRQK